MPRTSGMDAALNYLLAYESLLFFKEKRVTGHWNAANIQGMLAVRRPWSTKVAGQMLGVVGDVCLCRLDYTCSLRRDLGRTAI